MKPDSGEGGARSARWKRRLLSVRPLPVGLGLGVLIAVLGLVGASNVKYANAPAFDLDAELTVPALVSGAVLLGAAVGAWLAGSVDRRPRWPWTLLSVLFAAMAVDEVTGVHEALEDVTRIDWQTLYLPLMVAAGAAWLVVLLRLAPLPVAAALLLAGAGAWVLAGALEAVQWSGPRESERAVAGYGILMGVEELLELAGSAAFALAPLVAARSWDGADGRGASG